MTKAADLALGKIAALKTALIEFTDGDDAIAVADAGVVTLLTTAVAKSEGGAVTTNIAQGLIKCWLMYPVPSTSNGAVITTGDSFNLTSVTDNGDGQVMISMANDMASANYVLHVTGHSQTMGALDTGTQAAGQVRMETWFHDGNPTNSMGMASITGDLA